MLPDIKSHRLITLGVLSIILLLVWVLALVQGSYPLSLYELWQALWFEGSTSAELVLWQLRIPRALLAICAGAALGISGATIQGLFRNPLASPGLIGVSSGAALAAVGFIVLGSFGSDVLALPLVAFLGGLASTLIIARIARGPMGASVVSNKEFNLRGCWCKYGKTEGNVCCCWMNLQPLWILLINISY